MGTLVSVLFSKTGSVILSSLLATALVTQAGAAIKAP